MKIKAVDRCFHISKLQEILFSKKLLDIVYNNLAFGSRWDDLTAFVYKHRYLQIKNRKRKGSVSNRRENIKISGKMNIGREILAP